MMRANRYLACVIAFVAVLPLNPRGAVAGTVAHWKLDDGTIGTAASGGGSIKDVSGNHLDGTPIGGPIFDGTCPCDVGLRFDGVDDRVFVPDDPKLALTHSLTVEAVIRLDALPSGSGGQIVFRGDQLAGLDPYTLVVLFDGRLESSIDSGSAIDVVISPNPIPMGQVLHVASTLDDATGRHEIFINGVSAGFTHTSVRPYAMLSGPNPGVGIGNTEANDLQYFPGLIAEARISDVALTPAEFLSGCVPGQIKPYGAGCPGLGGVAPTLSMAGCPIGGGELTLSISNAAPLSTALLVFGLFETAIPLKGSCTLNASPILPTLFALPLGGTSGLPGSGSISLPFDVPPGTQSGTVKMQAFVRDTTNPWSYTVTNGLSVTIAAQ